MKKRRLMTRSIILIILLGAVAYTIFSSTQKETTSVKVGDQAPNFSLQSIDGETFELEKLKGKGLLINFWGTWCEPCKIEMPYMEELYKKYHNQGFEILAININETKIAVKDFMNEYGLTFPVMIDTRSDVLDAYKVQPLPTTFFVDPSGKITSIKTGTMTKEIIESEIKNVLPK